jgi:acyl-CoA synthetase (AMP-forming)/AMP-acid ligase II
MSYENYIYVYDMYDFNEEKLPVLLDLFKNKQNICFLNSKLYDIEYYLNYISQYVSNDLLYMNDNLLFKSIGSHNIQNRCLALSSGTTGYPKIVCEHYDTLWNSFEFIREDFLDDVEIIINTLPLNHMASALTYLCTRLTYTDKKYITFKKYDINDLLKCLYENRLKKTYVGLVGTMVYDLYRKDYTELSNLYAQYTGSPLTPTISNWIIDNRGMNFFNIYGQTEVINIAKKSAKNIEDFLNGYMDVTPKYSCELSEENEIIIKNHLFEGYLHEYTPNEYKPRYTGDLGESHDDMLKVLCRKDDLIIKGGENISPAYLEDLYGKYIDTEFCIIGIEHERLYQTIALVILQDIKIPKDLLLQNIPKFFLPEVCIILDEIPKTKSGKIKKKEIQNMYKDKKCEQILFVSL